MAFPVIATTGTTSQASSSSWTANLPASIAAGDLLLMIGQANGATTLTVPTGWTSLFNPGDGTFVFYKYASGSEGATVTISGSASRSAGIVCYRITGTDGVTAPAIGTLAVSTTTFDPPSLTPSWGSLKTLWLAIACARTNFTASVTPTSYALQDDQLSGGSNSRVMIYSRTNQVATEDPSAYTLSSSVGAAYAITIGIRPAAKSSSAFLAMFF